MSAKNLQKYIYKPSEKCTVLFCNFIISSPLLKKSGLDSTQKKNYRPVLNLFPLQITGKSSWRLDQKHSCILVT